MSTTESSKGSKEERGVPLELKKFVAEGTEVSLELLLYNIEENLSKIIEAHSLLKMSLEKLKEVGYDTTEIDPLLKNLEEILEKLKEVGARFSRNIDKTSKKIKK